MKKIILFVLGSVLTMVIGQAIFAATGGDFVVSMIGASGSASESSNPEYLAGAVTGGLKVGLQLIWFHYKFLISAAVGILLAIVA